MHLGPGGLVLVAAIVVSGCVSSQPSMAPGSSVPSATSVATEGTGIVQGMVTDDEQRPLGEAVVQLVARAAVNATPSDVKTGPDGAFSFKGLSAGEYVIHAARLGYEAAAPKKVDVREGETANANFVLTPLAVVEPHSETKPYTTYFHWYACVVTTAASSCPLLVFDGTNSTEDFDAAPKKGVLHTLVVESKWTSSIPVCTQGMRTAAYSPDQTGLTAFPGPIGGTYYWDNRPAVTSPTRLFIPRDGPDESAMLSPNRTEANDGEPIETAGKWHIQVFPTIAPQSLPAGVQCTIDQRVNVWVTGFFEGPAPIEWSVLAS